MRQRRRRRVEQQRQRSGLCPWLLRLGPPAVEPLQIASAQQLVEHRLLKRRKLAQRGCPRLGTEQGRVHPVEEHLTEDRVGRLSRTVHGSLGGEQRAIAVRAVETKQELFGGQVQRGRPALAKLGDGRLRGALRHDRCLQLLAQLRAEPPRLGRLVPAFEALGERTLSRLATQHRAAAQHDDCQPNSDDTTMA